MTRKLREMSYAEKRPVGAGEVIKILRTQFFLLLREKKLGLTNLKSNMEGMEFS